VNTDLGGGNGKKKEGEKANKERSNHVKPQKIKLFTRKKAKIIDPLYSYDKAS